nr:major capsid protein [Treponema sp.]
VQNAVKKDGIGLGNLAPQIVNKGGKYMGYVEIGAYRLDLFVYNGRYSDFNSSTTQKYVDEDKVIMLADVADLDFRCVYGGVPSIGMEEPFASIIPEKVTYGNGVRIHNRVYKDEKANTYSAESTVRPVCLPVSIDRFACFTVA